MLSKINVLAKISEPHHRTGASVEYRVIVNTNPIVTI